MSKKTDAVYTQYYEPHLNRGNFQRNRVNDEQALTERMYKRILTEACANRFTWIGLPDSVDPRFLELTLFYQGLAVFYWDDDYDKYFVLRATGTGPLNHYDNPTRFTVTGGSGRGMINKNLKGADCVPIWSNYLRSTDMDIVLLYSRKLAAMDRTIEIAADAMRYTAVVAADEKERLSYANAMRQRSEGQPIVFATKGFDMSQIQAFNVAPHPEALPNLLIAKSRMWNECMTMLGINNSNQDKRERLVADEVAANDDQIKATRDMNMNARLQAVEQINTKYGLSVECLFQDKPAIPKIGEGILD